MLVYSSPLLTTNQTLGRSQRRDLDWVSFSSTSHNCSKKLDRFICKNVSIRSSFLEQWAKGPSINEVTVLGGRRYQGFCDYSNKALVLKTVTERGRGVKNYQKLRDVIYGRPLRSLWNWFQTEDDHSERTSHQSDRSIEVLRVQNDTSISRHFPHFCHGKRKILPYGVFWSEILQNIETLNDAFWSNLSCDIFYIYLFSFSLN